MGRENGSVEVRWSLGTDRLDIVWAEIGAEDVVTPETTGFGTKLVETTIERIGGSIKRTWNPDGLSVAISLPLATL